MSVLVFWSFSVLVGIQAQRVFVHSWQLFVTMSDE